jgi:uncharacterized protein
VTGRPAAEPLTWNVSGLLTSAAGESRDYEIAGVTIDLGDLRQADPIEGRVRLRRTNRGILADADLKTSIEAQCSRCLRDIEVPIAVHVAEEYLPSIDVATGKPLAIEDEPDALRLTDHHELDLETPVREAIQLAEPIAPLCRPDCPGLCVTCGQPLEDGTHDHPDDDVDPRLEALKAFRVDGDGGTG